MSPNLAAGCAELSPQREDELALEPGMARTILQQWAEAKTEKGNVERPHIQVAQVWPLEDNPKFDGVEAPIYMLRQA